MLKPSHEGERGQTEKHKGPTMLWHLGNTQVIFWPLGTSVQQGESYMGRKINSLRGRIEQREPDSEFSACGHQAEGHRSHGPSWDQTPWLLTCTQFLRGASILLSYFSLYCAQQLGALPLYKVCCEQKFWVHCLAGMWWQRELGGLKGQWGSCVETLEGRRRRARALSPTPGPMCVLLYYTVLCYV